MKRIALHKIVFMNTFASPRGLQKNVCINFVIFTQLLFMAWDSPLGWTESYSQSKTLKFITVDPRLSFPDSVGGIFPGPVTTQKSLPGYWMVFMLIRGITAGDWHILLSYYLTLFSLRIKFDRFPSACEYNNIMWGAWGLTKMRNQLLCDS